MKLASLVFGLLLTVTAHAGLNDFAGTFRVVSGDTSNAGCSDMSITYEPKTETLRLISTRLNWELEKIPSINQGKVDWIKDLGDIVYRGTQKSEYDGKNHVNTVIHKKWMIGAYKKMDLYLDGSTLTIKSSKMDRDCVLSK